MSSTTNTASTGKQTTPKESTSERSKFMTQLELPLIYFVLKKFSTRQAPLYASKIAEYISVLTGEDHATKTVQRKLQKLCLLQNDADEENINDTLFLTFGGYIVETTNEDIPNVKRIQTRYYFQPFLDTSDVALICGAITSNRYLTPAEKAYLLTREQTLALCEDTTQNVKDIESSDYMSPTLPGKAAPMKNHTSTLLHMINLLHDAIENNYQLQIIYGIYDSDQNNFRHIQFRAKNTSKPYILNPYAMVWNGGAYYLLATHDGYDNPAHFRIDRIVSAQPVLCTEDASKKRPRAALPDALLPFFTCSKNSKPEFNASKYTATYPLMGIYDLADTQNCFIECTATTLSILIDHFGKDLMIQPSPFPHDKAEVDFHGNPQKFFAVRINQVQYDNVLQLCLQQHASITALHPHRLVADVHKGLTTSMEKYQKVIDLMDPEHSLRLKNASK